MPNIKPISVLRNTTEISELCHKINEPIFITKNGYGNLVIMSMETYERNQALADIYQKLGESEADAISGIEPIDGESEFV